MKLHNVREELDVNDANLAGSRFDDVNLQKAVFTNVNLSDATFSNINLTNMKINGVLVSELFAVYRSRTGAEPGAADC
jgi:uncharacterized protein YjbI with pentapeptide repeats